MKKIFIYIAALVVFSLILVGCTSNPTDPYVPNVSNNEFEPNGKTTVEVSEVQSGSALLTFNELENVSHYEILVSKTENFDAATTKILVSDQAEYRLFFDDNNELYIKSMAIASNGKAYESSDVKTILSPYANYVEGDDFRLGSVNDWSAINAYISSDFHTLIVKPNGLDAMVTISKTYSVDLDQAEIFEIKWITKNVNSVINASLKIDDMVYPVITNMSSIQRGYIRFDISELNLSGTKNIEVIITSEGQNPGFQIDYVRFIYETSHQDQVSFIDVEKTNIYNTLSIVDETLSIKNDAEPSIVITPSTEVNFDPMELTLLEITLSNYFPQDTFDLTIKDSLGNTKLNTGVMFIKNYDGKFSYDLQSLDIIEEDIYTISYVISNEDVLINKMQLVGESDLSIDVTQEEFTDGFSAYLNDDDQIKLKESTIYAYGDVRKTVTIDLGQTPIVFFNVTELTGIWAVKIIPDGATSDIPFIKDNGKKGKVAQDLSLLLQTTEVTTFTFVIFVVGEFAADQRATLKLDPIVFGSSLSIISNTSDEVQSETSYAATSFDSIDTGYVYIDVDYVSSGAEWKLYLVDLDTDKRYEMKTSLEKKYPNRYNRSKIGIYIFDIADATGLVGQKNYGVQILVIGNNAQVDIRDIGFTSNNNIPNDIVSAY